MDLETLNPEHVEAVLMAHGANSITYTDAGGEPVLEPGVGEAPLWGDTRVTALFAADADFASLRAELEQRFAPLPAHRVEALPERDWVREWLRDFGPMQFGQRLWILPNDASPPAADAITVRLDPGLAFGTGTHATTALCLEWLDRIALQGRTVLDYGCGSGVLAIAALKLGASRALAMDIDPQAVVASRENAFSNGVGEQLSVVDSAAGIDGDFDVVVANILAGPLIEHAESIAAHVADGCLLALSGILSEQVGDVLAAYRPWFDFDPPEQRDQDGQRWARLTGRKT